MCTAHMGLGAHVMRCGLCTGHRGSGDKADKGVGCASNAMRWDGYIECKGSVLCIVCCV
jgi:hypothetical protein